MADMTALRAHRRGGPEALVVETAPTPVPAVDEVLIAVHAAAITFDELTWEETWTRDGVSRVPVIPSHEISGTVVEKCSSAEYFDAGDDVYGLVRFDRDGGAADYVAVPAQDWPPSRAASRTPSPPRCHSRDSPHGKPSSTTPMSSTGSACW